MERLTKDLLEEWCLALLELQVHEPHDPDRDGGIMCPACNKIHGRCFEAMYPFLYMAKTSGDSMWIRSAEQLFFWAERTLSQADGSFINDEECHWKGTTVFNAIQLADCLIHHGDILSEATKHAVRNRLQRAAEFLYTSEEINDNNINYPISNALALYECGLVLGDLRFLEKAKVLASLAKEVMSENNLLFGEGAPRFQKSARGCYAIDIGYNVEETLPSLALYGTLSKDVLALEIAEKGLVSQLDFMVEDGAWDNSFGTRNFKWTYWGSRTSDGCALGYLLYADKYPEFALAVKKNLELMKECTVDGLLAGGLHYRFAGQLPCVHHTFTHAKVLAGILDRKLCGPVSPDARLPRQQVRGIRHYPEIDSWLINMETMTATITAYDWEYLPGGHVSGGSLSLWHHKNAGTLLCAGMSHYTRYEPHNMQVPVHVRHESLALRIEKQVDDCLYSSVYEACAQVEVTENRVMVSGCLKDIDGKQAEGRELPYSFIYEWQENRLNLKAEFAEGVLICPLVSRSDEPVEVREDKKGVSILKCHGKVCLETSGILKLPFGNERIFNLVPGFQALQVDLEPVNRCLYMSILVLEK